MNEQFVLVEFRNTERVVGKRPITLDQVVRHFQNGHDFDQESDTITFLDQATDITLE